MDCPYVNKCGGCPLREMSTDEYRQIKKDWFAGLVHAIKQQDIKLGEAIFIADGLRRRAELTFSYNKGRFILGFNATQSHEIIDIEKCVAITSGLNEILLAVRRFLEEFCQIKNTQKIKKKMLQTAITHGEIWLTEADNGIDVLIEIDDELSLQHRMLISEFVATEDKIIRISVGKKFATAETIVEKVKPFIDIAGKHVFIPAGTFLQPSKEGEQALINLVMKYMGETSGKIADLFCGVGTFSYPLAANIKNKITAVDSSVELLNGFRQTVNALMLPNIEIVQKNLFKYPLDEAELKDFAAVVFDPPRAGAVAQVQKLANVPMNDKPQKVIAVSCNPHTFINDANTLIAGGYEIKEMTMVDQFVYAKHFELVALFMKKGEENESE